MKVVAQGKIRFPTETMDLKRRAHSFLTIRRVADLQFLTGKNKTAIEYHKKDLIKQRQLVIKGINQQLDTIKTTKKLQKKFSRIVTAILS